MIGRVSLGIVILGSIQLLIFFLSQNLHLPTDIFSTSSIVLMFGLSIAIIAISISLSAFPLAYITLFIQKNYIYQGLLFQYDKNVLLKTIKLYLYLTAPEILLFFSVALDISFKEISTFFYIFYLIQIPILIALIFKNPEILRKYNLESTKLKTFTLLKILSGIVLIKIFWSASLLFGIIIAYKFIEINSIGTDSAIIIIYVVLNYFLLLPVRNKTKRQEEREKRDKKNVMAAFNAVSDPIKFVIILCSLSLIWVWPNNFVTSANLRLLQIGGNIERQYHFDSRERFAVPSEVIENCSTESACITKPLIVLIHIGNLLIVKIDSKVEYLPGNIFYPIITRNEIKKGGQ